MTMMVTTTLTMMIKTTVFVTMLLVISSISSRERPPLPARSLRVPWPLAHPPHFT